MKKSFADLGVESRWRARRSEFAAFIKAEMDKYAKLIKEANIKVNPMKPIGVAVIGTGWCGGIRAETLRRACAGEEPAPRRDAARSASTKLKAKLKPATATTDYRELLSSNEIEAVYISATPESTHYPMAQDCLNAGKHVFLEKPIAIDAARSRRADRDLAKNKKLKFTIGYSQRFNPKFAYVRKCIRDGTIGKPVSALVSRHITRMPRQEDQRPHQALARGDGRRRTTSTSSSGASSRRSRCASTRR